MCLEISPLIIYPIIDRLLGGSTAEMFIPQRPLTAIELRLIRRIIDRALTSLAEAWANIAETRSQLEETESNPQLVQIVPPNEVVVVVGFELKMGGRAGTMSLCIPFNVIEPVISQAVQPELAELPQARHGGRRRHRVAKRIERRGGHAGLPGRDEHHRGRPGQPGPRRHHHHREARPTAR